MGRKDFLGEKNREISFYLERRKIVTEWEFRYRIIEKIEKIISLAGRRNIWIYGAGVGGRIVYEELKKRGILIKGYIDKRWKEIGTVGEYPVVWFDLLSPTRDFIIVSLMSYDLTIWMNFEQKGFKTEDFIILVKYACLLEEDTEYKGCFVGRGTVKTYENFLRGSGNVKYIGRFCSINYSSRVEGNHPMDTVTTNPIVYTFNELCTNEKNIANVFAPVCRLLREASDSSLIIGNDVWIGANAVILPHVKKIGDGAIIGANAAVTHDVEPYTVVVGVPARIIRYRYSEKVRRALTRIKWWDWEMKTIADRISDFSDVENFVKKYDVE